MSAEDVVFSSLLNNMANIKPQDQNTATPSVMSRSSPGQRKQHNLRALRGAPPKERATAEPTNTGEKRRRGRPRKEQPHAEQIRKEHPSGSLKRPSQRLGHGHETAATNAITEKETFDVPDDDPEPTAKPVKVTGTRKQPQRYTNPTKPTAGVKAATNVADKVDSKKKAMINQVKRAKATAIREHEESLRKAGKTSSSSSDDSSHPKDNAQFVVPESQDASKETLGNRKVGKALLLAADEPINSVEKRKLLQEEASEAAPMDEDSSGDPEYQPPGAAKISRAQASNSDAEGEEQEEDNMSESAPSERNGEERKGRSSKKRKRNPVQAADRMTRSPEPSESDAVQLELFGRERDWKVVLDGARTVGVSNLKGKTVKEKPTLETETVRGLVDSIKDTVTLYKQLDSLLKSGSSDEDVQNIEERLSVANQEILEDIENISEANAGSKKGEMIQDIYAHAIPTMVFGLKAAMECRKDQYSREDDITNLQEIIRNQDLLLHLCHEARQWKAKPLTDRPITNSTSQKIGPYLRDVRKAFQQELESRERAMRQQSNDDAIAQSHERRRERLERQKQLNARKRAEQRIKIMRNLEQNPTPYRSRTQPSQAFPGLSTFPRHQRSPSMTADQWTAEQNLELVSQLMRQDIRYLPGRSCLMAQSA